ncbi:hypothetical protein T07_13120 [Trichinella nelsoni]|uniref:Uncharacterized protein n=1 Tax=Trichinella nelsoni TaxID=6336 RepID=A0A0V0RCV1_9BILA|nr:hypothetical protein T07_13120 [Trichinella nelsoni]
MAKFEGRPQKDSREGGVGKPKNGFDHDQLGVIRPLVGHGNCALRQLWKADTCYSLVLVVHLQREIASGVATEGP